MHNLALLASAKGFPRRQVGQGWQGAGGACPSSALLPDQRLEPVAKVLKFRLPLPPQKLLWKEVFGALTDKWQWWSCS